jgi:hypothetical protein
MPEKQFRPVLNWHSSRTGDGNAASRALIKKLRGYLDVNHFNKDLSIFAMACRIQNAEGRERAEIGKVDAWLNRELNRRRVWGMHYFWLLFA